MIPWAEVIVATDDKRVYDAVLAFGGSACMTREDHPNGTSRLAEVAEKYPDADVIVNVQGDEPMIPPEIIDRLAEAFQAEPGLQMATMKTLMQESAGRSVSDGTRTADGHHEDPDAGKRVRRSLRGKGDNG